VSAIEDNINSFLQILLGSLFSMGQLRFNTLQLVASINAKEAALMAAFEIDLITMPRSLKTEPLTSFPCLIGVPY
jgi:hypothetical protein